MLHDHPGAGWPAYYEKERESGEHPLDTIYERFEAVLTLGFHLNVVTTFKTENCARLL